MERTPQSVVRTLFPTKPCYSRHQNSAKEFGPNFGEKGRCARALMHLGQASLSDGADCTTVAAGAVADAEQKVPVCEIG
eukprot:2242442-Pleurochrysis_carterae.AAC.1